MTETNTRKISELVEEARAGCKEAKGELLNRFKPLIYATIKKHNTGRDWEDLKQSAYQSILEGIEKYDTSKGIPFPAYIKVKLNYDIYNLCRKERTIVARSMEPSRNDLNPLDLLVDEKANIEELVVKKEKIALVQAALAALDVQCREVIEQAFFHNLSLKEIAKRMDISYRTVKRYKAKAMEQLYEFLKD